MKPYTPPIERFQKNKTEYIIIGAEDINYSATAAITGLLQNEKPDALCVELDSARLEILSDVSAWENKDIKAIARQKQMGLLFSNLLLVNYQKRFDKPVTQLSGGEYYAAISAANKLDIPVALCARNLSVTLNRAWRKISFADRANLLRLNFKQFFKPTRLTEEAVRALSPNDIQSILYEDFGRTHTILTHTLQVEGERYLAHKINHTAGQKIMVVLGAGHVKQVAQLLQNSLSVDPAELEQIPPKSRWANLLGWLIPIIVIGTIIYTGFSQGGSEAADSLLVWVLSNSIPAGIGAIAAKAHPITIITAFLVAPFTSLFPLIGGGTVAAVVQAWVEPPTVRQIQLVGDEIFQWRKWWQNSVLRILLVLLFAGLAGLIGTYIGLIGIATNLVE